MTLDDFFLAVESDTGLCGVAIDEEKMVVRIVHRDTGILTEIGVEAIERNDWSMLRDVLYAVRSPQCLTYMARVVGYYSRVENWNKSKLGELKSRIRGNYDIDGIDSGTGAVGMEGVEERTATIEGLQKSKS